MEEIRKIEKMLDIFNQMKSYTYTYEEIDNKLYIRNTVSFEAVTKLYGILDMIQGIMVLVREDRESYDIYLEVRELIKN